MDIAAGVNYSALPLAFAINKLPLAFRREAVCSTVCYQLVVFHPGSKEAPFVGNDGWRQSDGEINGCHRDCLFSWELRLWRLTLADGEINTAYPCVQAACQVSDLPELDLNWTFKRRAISAWMECAEKLSFWGDVQSKATMLAAG